MQKIEVKSIQLPNGERTGYRESGNGDRVLLLIHGNMTSSKHWDIVMSNFPDGYRVLAIDQRGFGNSSYNTPITSIRDFADDIKLFADRLQLHRFAVAGWSLGGAIAMQFASDHPEYVDKLVLIGSVGVKGYVIPKKDERGFPLPNEPLRTREEIASDPLQIAPILRAYQTGDRNFLRLLWNALIYTHNQPPPEKYEEYLDDMLTQRNYVDTYYALARFNISHFSNGVVMGTGAVNRISAPTLIIQGDRDNIIPPATAHEILKSIGENALLSIINDCGHSPPIDALETLLQLITGFLDDER